MSTFEMFIAVCFNLLEKEYPTDTLRKMATDPYGVATAPSEDIEEELDKMKKVLSSYNDAFEEGLLK